LEPSNTPVDGNLPPSSVPILEPCFEPSSVPAAATDINVKSYFKDYYYRRSNVYDDSPSKATIFSSSHNLRLPVGMLIFILLLAAHNSEPSAVPSLIPSAIPSMEPSLKPSTAPISAPYELAILFLTALTSAETSFTSTVQSSVSITVPSLEPSLISTTVRSCPIQISLSSSIPSLEPRSFPSSIPSLEPSSLSSSIPSLEPSICPGLLQSSTLKLEPSYDESSVPSIIPSAVPNVDRSTDFTSLEPSLISTDTNPEPSYVSILRNFIKCFFTIVKVTLILFCFYLETMYKVTKCYFTTVKFSILFPSLHRYTLKIKGLSLTSSRHFNITLDSALPCILQFSNQSILTFGYDPILESSIKGLCCYLDISLIPCIHTCNNHEV
jgi:hypothetical protein